MDRHVDLIVVGGGPGGYVAAIRGAQLGAKVALVHNDDLGGTCLNRGCIPSKALIHCATVLQDAKAAKALGMRFAEPEIDFDKVRAHTSRTALQLTKGVMTLVEANGIVSLGGRGRLVAPNEVAIEEDGKVTGSVTAPAIIWATGSLPTIIPVPGVEGQQVITSDDGVCLPGPPKSLAIIGAGALGSEFAYIYSQFGTKVHLIEMMERILPAEEPETSEILAAEMSKLGIRIHTQGKCMNIGGSGGSKALECDFRGETETLEVDMVMMATGRHSNTGDMGLEDVGVELQGTNIVVDDNLRTNIDGIFAVGDCIRGHGLAHRASAEGIAAVELALGARDEIGPFFCAMATFTRPEISSCGLRETAAREAGYNINIGKFPFGALGKAAAMRRRAGFVKLIGDADTDRLLGASIVGEHASDLIAEICLAIRIGARMTDVAETCHVHPTLTEALGEAALDGLGRVIHMPPQ
jgi:dihydrolipoamide dehydrogenase